jgi:hypothetical protein
VSHRTLQLGYGADRRLTSDRLRIQDRIGEGDFARSGESHRTPSGRRHHFHKYKERDAHELPAGIDGSEWQAGVSLNSEKFHVLLNGEPVLMAVAASAIRGWVIRLINPPSKATERLTGYVAIVRGD